MTQAPIRPGTVDDQMAAALALADGALGAAGHEMSDPVIREIWTRVASREITGDQAVKEIDELSRAGHFKS
ncbi:MAG: hypothetical protein QG597_4521 [Actinomycetota bacterium]|nr:hypothetical protein [Actinomycetota bacterium]